MKLSTDNGWGEETNVLAPNTVKYKRNKLCEHELEELREHIDLVSFNIAKVYRHAKDRTRKELNKSKNSFRKKLHHSYKNEKIRI